MDNHQGLMYLHHFFFLGRMSSYSVRICGSINVQILNMPYRLRAHFTPVLFVFALFLQNKFMTNKWLIPMCMQNNWSVAVSTAQELKF